MKNNKRKSIFVTLAAAILFVGMLTAAEKHQPFELNKSKSTLDWEGRKVTGSHNGRINFEQGLIHIHNKKLVGGEFMVKMETLTVLDLKDKETNGKLVGHLKSDDFFSVEKHPMAHFVMTKVWEEKSKDGNYMIVGDLTIKGIIHSVRFPAKVDISKNKVDAKAKVIVDRAKYDIRFNSGSFFENLGDKLIYDDFTFNLNLSFDLQQKGA